MKKLMHCLALCAAMTVIASGQGVQRFPGLSPMHIQMLEAAKRTTPIPLPTWLPAGFRAEKVNLKLGSTVPIEERVLEVIYSHKLPNGKMQRFAIEAGFEGIGDLPYDTTSSVRSKVGKIEIAYEPPDADGGGKKLKDFAMTQWFSVGKTAYHYDGMYGAEPGSRGLAMISLAETQKILQSLERF